MDSSNSSMFLNNHMLTSSESENENENRNNIALNSDEIFNLKNSSDSSLSHQMSYKSFKYFKKLKRKNTFHDSEPQHKNKYSTSPYSVKSLNTKHTLPESKNVSNNKKKKQLSNCKNSNHAYSNSTDLNKELPYTLKSSPDFDPSNSIYLKLVSKNDETSPVGKKLRPNKSYSSSTNKEQPIVDSSINNNNLNEHFASSTSSNSFDMSQMNIDSEFIKKKKNQELDLKELLHDCSLSSMLFASKDSGDSSSSHSSSIYRNSQSYISADIDTSFSQMELTSTQLPLRSNVSLGIIDDTLAQEQSNVINFPELINDDNEDLQSKTEIGEQSFTLNHEHSKVNQSNLLSDEVCSNELTSEPKLNVFTSNYSVNLESPCSNCERCSSRLKNNSKNTSHISEKKKKKLSESKHSHLKTLTNIPDDLRIKKFIHKKNTNHSTSIVENDIGLQYDTDKDNYMVELPNGAVVPAFLSTLKPKYAKKLCACGTTMEEIPESWSESFHNILHSNIYKLRFVGNFPENDIVKLKHNNLSYRIVMFSVNDYNDENIKKSITNVDDFVCLEYGIPKMKIHSLKQFTYLAVLTNLKVIGYLEVEPIKNAFILTHDEQFSEIVPAKFGISKIWVLIKYKDKNVDINLLETFRKKEKLQKEDMAFSLSGCQGVQFLKKYYEKENVLVYI